MGHSICSKTHKHTRAPEAPAAGVLRGVAVLADHGAVNVADEHEARLRAARERADRAPRQLERTCVG